MDRSIPLIGILMQNAMVGLSSQVPNPYYLYSFVQSRVVDYIKQTGAIPVLVPYNLSDQKLEQILEHVQGFLLPGGSSGLADINTGEPTQLMRAIQKIVDHSKKRFDEDQVVFPVFGICMGFQALMIEASHRLVLTFDFDNKDVGVPIKLDEKLFPKSRVFCKLDQDLLRRNYQRGYVHYWHTFGINLKNLEKEEFKQIREEYNILGTSESEKDGQKVECIALVEHKKYPIFGTQYHPEKNPQWHDGLILGEQLADVFVEMARPAAKLPEEVPSWIKVFFSTYMVPQPAPNNNNCKVYLMPNLYAPVPGLDY